MTKTILTVEGMSCSSCVAHVKQALTIEGVATVDVRLAEGAVAVEHEAGISAGRLIAALEQAGYEATPAGRTGHV